MVENLVLPLSDLVLGRAILKHLRFVRKSQWWSAEELKEFQNEKLRALVKHAYENVPYYHDVFKEKKLTVDDIRTTDDLAKLPILTKEIIRENFPHRIVAKNIAGNEMILDGSSGSTGEPLQYYTTKDAYSFNIACVFRGWSWAGFQLGDRYIKLSQNPREGLINKMQDLAQRCEYIHSQSLTSQDIADIVEVIRKSDAKLIRGYPSTLYVLSQYIEKERITDIRPAAVTTTGEILFPHMRKLIESQFHCMVFDAYSGEGGANVSECQTHEAYHISAEYAFTELVDGGERIGLEGKGEIVSTNLWNYALPFIRYNVKDIGVLGGKKCSCERGLPVLQRIEGRDSDILVTPSGKYLIVHFFTGYFEWVDTVKQFQVVQEAIDRIILKLVPSDKFNEEARGKIEKDVKEYIGSDVELEIKIVDDIPLARSGKRRFVISEVAASSGK
jgi:phenylacetate-CoA ligase